MEIDVQEPDLEEPTEEGRPKRMLDVAEDILMEYTSVESGLTRDLGGVGIGGLAAEFRNRGGGY